MHKSILLFISLFIASLYALTFIDISYIKGIGPYWTEPYGDRITNLIGLEYFINDNWRNPLFYVKNLSIPEGANIIFTDSIPILALISKIFYKISGYSFNYFGIYVFLCFPLIAFFAARSSAELNLTKFIPFIVILCVVNPALLIRVGHASLMGHFLIIWAIYIYIMLYKYPNKKTIYLQLIILPALTLLIQSYFIIMVLPFTISILLQNFKDKRILFKNLFTIFIFKFSIIFFIAYFIGLIGGDVPSSRAWGFGYYSMNALSPFIPPKENLPNFLINLIKWDGNNYSWDETGGQYEGYNYLGGGLLFLLIINLIFSTKYIHYYAGRHSYLFASLVCLVILSLSNIVYIGNFKISLDFLFDFFKIITDHFRTSGRLFWPVYYVLVLFFILLIARRFSFSKSLIIISIATSIQLMDTELLRSNASYALKQSFKQDLNKDHWLKLFNRHDFVYQYPSYQCGGLFGNWPENNINLELLLLLSKVNIPTNSAYLARNNRDCIAEKIEALSPKFQDEGLYIYSKNFPIHSVNGINDFHGFCRSFDHGFVCSKKWKLFQSEELQYFKEIIISELVPILNFNTVYNFNIDGNGLKYIQSGFYSPEIWGSWGSSPNLFIIFSNFGDLNKINEFRLSSYSFTSPNSVIVKINDVIIGKILYFEPSLTLKINKLPIPHNTLKRNGLNKIEFISENSSSPFSLGVSDDKRNLGFGLIEFEITNL